jgi:transposase InsO family protein
MSSAANATTARIILKDPDNWLPWLEMVKSTATTGQVWEYVDPSKTTDQIPTLPEPKWPESSDLPLTAEEQDSGTLTPAHKEQLTELRSLYKLRLSRYDQRKASLASLHRIIQETVHPDRVHHTFECDSVHQMLVNLQQRLKPRDDVRRLQLTDQYRELQKSPKNKNLDTWIITWEKVYREGIALTQPIVQKDTAVQDFLRAVFDIAPDFSSFWTNTIQSSDDTTQRPDLYAIIDRFRVQRQILGVESKSMSRSAFSATLQGQQVAKPKSPCICGKYHWYDKCWYLDDTTAPAGWKENPATRKIVQEQLKKPEKKAAVDRALQKGKQETKETTNSEEKKDIEHQSFALSVFTTTNNNDDDDFPLRQSFILDSGADVHVCNDVSRATGPIRLASPGERIAAGSGWVPIIGYGEIAIKTKAPAPRHQQTMKLHDVAFVPSFFTSVVSLKKLIKGGIDWLTRDNKLMLGKRLFCLVEERFGQWVLEYNPFKQELAQQPSNFAVRSSQARISKAPATVWHERLAHCGPEVLEHLPTGVTGVKLVDGPTTSECEVCGLSKAHKIISRRPSPLAEEPFDRVHWDMMYFSEGFNGDWYASHFLDDKTRMNWVYTHSEKTQAELLGVFQEFEAFVKRQFNRKIKIFRVDGEPGLGKLFDTWATDEGIDFETSTPYSPEQNGSAERSGGVIATKARCIRIRSSIPEDMWPETVKAAAYLVNRTPSKHLGWKSPFEVLQFCRGRSFIQPDIGHLKVYGCKTYVHIPKEIREKKKHHKLAPRAKIGYLVGYQSTNIYRIWIPQDGEVRPEKDIHSFTSSSPFHPSSFHHGKSPIVMSPGCF